MLRRCLALFLLVLLTMGCCACADPAASPSAEETPTNPIGVPRFEGLSIDFVMNDPEICAQFAFETVTVSSDRSTGTIVAQNPKAGEIVEFGSKVTLSIAD